MWSHFCKAENAIVHIKNKCLQCDWCGEFKKVFNTVNLVDFKRVL